MKKALAATIGAFALAAALAVPAQASTQVPSAAATAALEVTSSSGTTWAAATTAQASEGLQIKIFAPKQGSHRRMLWQKCSFSGSYAGTYKCGIDTSKGSLAQKREGTWVAKVFAGGVRVARTSFTI